ncbi:uncharacterized protein EV420DRAFT_1540280 [Desarmillaria tabescens]|uniref:Uncharacterized protein n=1 Tax=Armillaria tabescens TaxID=1929756 RepID=A0AA39KCQ2_ARMTA|nr:uncharacterized protein EV420DRAFT_1540280 [Desarmillaria tabescens]KAK0458744.1 hypothetical protein EV420DRAFT_1540280 [Desarmillaria tabescens]
MCLKATFPSLSNPFCTLSRQSRGNQDGMVRQRKDHIPLTCESLFAHNISSPQVYHATGNSSSPSERFARFPIFTALEILRLIGSSYPQHPAVGLWNSTPTGSRRQRTSIYTMATDRFYSPHFSFSSLLSLILSLSCPPRRLFPFFGLFFNELF